MVFPKGSILEFASSACPVEGAWNEDGKNPYIQDNFSHHSGLIVGDRNGDIACDHYRRRRENLYLLRDLDVAAYGFPVSCLRVVPEGKEKVNVKGLVFYEELADRLEGCT
jgi:beta-glucosidase/6-phospho-beta-glucosidase/beta-galactosidase